MGVDVDLRRRACRYCTVVRQAHSCESKMTSMIRVVLLAYNEGESIGSVLFQLRKHLTAAGSGCRVYVVNDGSTDDTVARVERLFGDLPLTVLNHETNLGVARAFDTGLRAALGDSDSDDVIVTMEADGTNQPKVVGAMADKLHQGCDVVCASRFCEGGGYVHFPWKRHLFSLGANWILRFLFPIAGLRDYTIFFRAYRASLLKDAFDYHGGDLIKTRGFVSNAEILVKLRRFKPKASECALLYDYSLKKSTSKMNVWSNTVEYFKFIWEQFSR